MTKSKILEQELYPPLRDYFLSLNYQVKGEVKSCDLIALKKDELIVIEIKTSFTMKLIFQAIDRLSITDQVYIAFLRPSQMGRKTNWKHIKRLTGRLGLGVILLSPRGNRFDIQIYQTPKIISTKKNNKKREKLLKEFNERTGDRNTGGIHHQKLITAYKEKSIHLATLLAIHGEKKPKELRDLGGDIKTTNILYRNVYHWFSKKENGSYFIKESTIKEIKKDFKDLWEYYKNNKI